MRSTVVAVDTNLLVYAHRAGSNSHAAALRLLTDLADGGGRWAIPWPCVHEFCAGVTHPRIYSPPTPLRMALDAIRAWGASAGCEFIGESEGYLDRLEDVAVRGRVEGGAIHDARIAALCLHHGVKELWTVDRDFSRFPALRVRNPLVS